MEALLKAIASGLVEKPEDIVVTSEEQENGTTVYHLHVAEDDMGRVIGKQGHADRLGDAPLLADDTTHVGLGHFEVIDDGAVLTRGVNGHLHGLLVLNKAAGNG